MSFLLSEVTIADAENIARYVEVPAIQTGPLFRTMFPSHTTMTEMQQEEVVQWYTEMLSDAVQAQEERLLKACSTDGVCVGFCGWTIAKRSSKDSDDHSTDNQTTMTNKGEGGAVTKKESWLPQTLDIDSWIMASKALRMERERALRDHNDICRQFSQPICRKWVIYQHNFM